VEKGKILDNERANHQILIENFYGGEKK